MSRILVIDDHDEFRKMISRVLTQAGYEVLTAVNGMDGLDVFQNEYLDLVVTDLNMPIKSGVEFLKEARNIGSDVDILVLTGHSDEATAIQCLRLGAYDYLLKPLESIDMLLIAVKQALHKRELEKLVLQRTKNLEQLNVDLKSEISKRRQVEEKYRAMVESSSDWIWEVDVNGTYTYVSPKVTDLLGYSPDDVLGKTPFDFMLPKEADRVAKEFLKIVESQAAFVEIENINIHKNGDLITLETSGIPIIDGDGRFIGYRGIDRDISDRKEVERVLRENEQQLRLLVQHIQAAIVVHDRDTKIVISNAKAQELLGLDEDQLRGRDATDSYWKFFRQDGSPLPLDQFPVACVLKLKQPVIDFILGIQLPNGERLRWVLVNAVPVFKYEDIISQVMVTFMDITELKEKERTLQKLSTAIEQSPVSVVITDLAGKIEYVNPEFKTLTGYKQMEAVGQKPSILKSGKHTVGFYKEIWGSITSGKTWHGTFQNKKKNGDLYWESATIAPVKDSQGKIVNFVALKKNITRRIQAEREREKTIAQLQEALENITTLSGLLPICASCKKIRDDKGYWNQIEAYIEKHSEAAFSHGICPECAEELYGTTSWYKKMKEKKNS